MLAFWGISQDTLRMYELLDEDEKKQVCFVTGGTRNRERYKDRLIILAPGQLRSDEIDQLLIPACEMRIQNAILWEVYRKTDLRADQILIMDAAAFSRQLKKYGTAGRFLSSGRIPFLCAVEYDVVHHCNLKCRGCSHFSPLSKPGTGNPAIFRRDLRRLRELADEIGEIRLVGGEPLLCDDLPVYIEHARELFPDAQITVFTNGIRLAGIGEALKACMKRYDARFKVSFYPPVRNYVQEVEEKLEKEGIGFESGFNASFFGAWLNPAGDSDPAAAAAACLISFCHAIDNGRLFKCSTECRISVFEAYYQTGAGFPEGGIDLYDPDLTSGKLYTYLMSPVSMCRFCGRTRTFPWDRAGKHPQAQDWYGGGKL